jgi:hypothetical protein
VLAGRFRWAGVGGGLALGVVLQATYPGEFTYHIGEGGPGWAVWVALGGGILALAAAIVWRLEGPSPTAFAALAALAFVLPIAVTGFADAKRDDQADPWALTPGLVRELREIDRRHVVFSNLETSYRIAAVAPVRIAAAPPAHVARTKLNRPYDRRRDVVRFFFRPGTTDAEREQILDNYAATWVVVDKTRRYPEEFVRTLVPVYEDDRYILYRRHPALE